MISSLLSKNSSFVSDIDSLCSVRGCFDTRNNYERSFVAALRIAERFDFRAKYKRTGIYVTREITILMDITIANASPASLDVLFSAAFRPFNLLNFCSSCDYEAR